MVLDIHPNSLEDRKEPDWILAGMSELLLLPRERTRLSYVEPTTSLKLVRANCVQLARTQCIATR